MKIVGWAGLAMALALGPALMGCATVTTMNVHEGRYFGPYSGTRLDLKAIAVTDDDKLRRLSYADIPLSFACDTVQLPLSLLDAALPGPIVFRPPQ